MNGAIDYARESILTAPDDLEQHVLLEWARGKAPLVAVAHPVLEAIVREWWFSQIDAGQLLRELILVDRRMGVLGACACAQWALDRYWGREDSRPQAAVDAAMRWARGEATEQECADAGEKALAAAISIPLDPQTAARDAAISASDAAGAVHKTDRIDVVFYAAAKAAGASASAMDFVGVDWDLAQAEALKNLCDVVRAAVECPPVEVWFALEFAD